jgi:hypothetical protein
MFDEKITKAQYTGANITANSRAAALWTNNVHRIKRVNVACHCCLDAMWTVYRGRLQPVSFA